jgi:hypothetical protein
MSDSNEAWPLPNYNVGPREHLHAIGTIALCYNAFERGIFDLYCHYQQDAKVPNEIADFFFLSLSEGPRIEAIKLVVRQYEKDAQVVAFFESLMTYFEWAWKTRNQILHSELHPSIFGGHPNDIELSKRRTKKTSEIGYLRLSVLQLREIADAIEKGKRACASLRVYLYQRTVPRSHWNASHKLHGPEPLHEILVAPASLELAPHPIHPIPPHLRRS